jgi:hypothetical protein
MKSIDPDAMFGDAQRFCDDCVNLQMILLKFNIADVSVLARLSMAGGRGP